MSEKNYTKVQVRSVNLMQGQESHCRGGHRWPVKGRTVLVSDALLAALRACPFTSVDAFVKDEAEAEPLDLITAKDYRDPAVLAQQQKADLEAELAALKAADEIAALQAEIEARKSGKKPPAAKPEGKDEKKGEKKGEKDAS